MKRQKTMLLCIPVLILFAGCSERGSAAVPQQDVGVLARQLNSEDQTIRDNAAKILLRASAPMQKYVEENRPEVLNVPLTELLTRFDVSVRDAVRVLAQANPQASKHVYIFQAYCWPQYNMRHGVGDSLRYIRPPEDLTGKWAYWHSDGTLGIEETYEKGTLHGVKTYWHRTSKRDWKRQEVVYEHGKVASSIEWDEQGQERFRNYWEDGVHREIRSCWYKNNTKEEVSIYKNSKSHGSWLGWYENGQKSKEENWQEGKRHGTLTVWYRSGQMMHTGEWKEGLQQNLSTGWFEDGQKQREEIYDKGKLKGRQTVWDWIGNIVSEKAW